MIDAVEPMHFDKILKLNAEFVHWLSPLDMAGLQTLLGSTLYARQIDDGDAVLLAIASKTEMSNHTNLDWLKARRENFIYIDRVIVAAGAQGKGYAGRLYADLADFARQNGYDSLTCEVNTQPDNPGSHAFHLRQGYRPIGEQNNPDMGKCVRYYAKALN